MHDLWKSKDGKEWALVSKDITPIDLINRTGMIKSVVVMNDVI